LARECGIILIAILKLRLRHLVQELFNITKSKAGFIELLLKYSFPVRILHTPYANEIRLKEYFGENKRRESIKSFHRPGKIWQMNFVMTGVNLLTAHLYMNKRGAEVLEEPEGEKPIKIGNADLSLFG
jgi:exonuclease SbcD